MEAAGIPAETFDLLLLALSLETPVPPERILINSESEHFLYSVTQQTCSLS